MNEFDKELMSIRRRKILFLIIVIIFVIGIIVWAIIYNLNKPESSIEQDYARQRAAGIQEAKSNKQFQSTFDVINMLPTAGNDYEITYGASPTKPGHYAIIINDYGIPGGKQHALDAITAAGYNPNNYEIIYESNPPTAANP